MDRLLALLLTRARQLGTRGDPRWLAVAVALWAVRRARRPAVTVWRGQLRPGERLVISSFTPGSAEDG